MHQQNNTILSKTYIASLRETTIFQIFHFLYNIYNESCNSPNCVRKKLNVIHIKDIQNPYVRLKHFVAIIITINLETTKN